MAQTFRLKSCVGLADTQNKMAFTGNGPRDVFVKNGPLGHVLQRRESDTPSVNQRQGHMCQPLLLQRALEVVEGGKGKGTDIVLACDGKIITILMG